MQHHALSHTLRDANPLHCNLGHGHWRVADNAADYAIHLATRNTTGYATDHTHGWWRGFFFLNDFNLLWNLRRGTELPVHDVSLHYLNHANCGRGWGRRRWRRGRD